MVGAQAAMKLAFWKRKRSRRSSPGPADADVGLEFDPAAGEADPDEAAALLLRVRTRRRLIGACALLLAVVVLVPMLLDPTPRAVPDNIPIELPSDKTPFAPRLLAPAPEVTGASGAPAAPGSAADTAVDAQSSGPAPAGGGSASKAGDDHSARGKKHPPTSGDAGKSESKHAVRKSDTSAPAQARIFLQAAALADEDAAQELASRLALSGLAPSVERTDTNNGVRFRVRLGPFASRWEAERSRARLRALGVNSNIVGA